MDLLATVVRDYAWGATSGIPELIGREPDGTPQAELWIGAHPSAPSTLVSTGEKLDAAVARTPEEFLGAAVRGRFGDDFPFLLKILSAAQALSIQAHPSEAQAREGFAREEAAQVPLQARERNYKDPHHKPEMIVALTEFHALSGFRTPADILAVLRALPELGEVAEGVRAELIAGLASAEPLRAAVELLLSGRARVREFVDALYALDPAEVPEVARGPLATVREVYPDYPSDPGVAVSLLLNRRVLAPGEALFLPAGNLHAYLRGFGVEIMASSDNVMRGGLTPKHIDVPELVRILDFAPYPAEFERPSGTGRHLVYAPDVAEFELHRIELADEPIALDHRGPATGIVTAGEAVIRGAGQPELRVGRGQSFLIGAADRDVTVSGEGVLFYGTVSRRG